MYYQEGLIVFNDGSGHLATIIPGTEGYAFILDPAGKYLTPNFGSTAARKAPQELQAYSDYWNSYGGISTIELYRVTDFNGNYELVASGNVSQVALAFNYFFY